MEAPGNNPSQAWKRQTQGEPWSTGDDYNMGIGQGFVTATPLQVAQMAAVVANGGFLYRPTIIHHMTDENPEITSRGYTIALISAIVLSSTAIFIRYLTQTYQIPPLVLAFWRDLFVILSLGAILIFVKPAFFRLQPGFIKFLVFYGFILAQFNAFWTLSVAINGAAVATVLSYTSAGFAADVS